MANAAFRSSSLIGVWLATVTMIVVASMAMGANLSTTAVVFALGIAPAFVIALLAHREPSLFSLYNAQLFRLGRVPLGNGEAAR